jgi:general secretion pathway protein G
MRRILKAVRSQRGFTLIELLVVIGILAALAGVVTLAVSQFIGRGACQACLTDRHNVQTAVVAYMADNVGEVPADVAAIGAYLLDNPKYNWTWDASTGVVNQTCIDQGIDGCVPQTGG